MNCAFSGSWLTKKRDGGRITASNIVNHDSLFNYSRSGKDILSKKGFFHNQIRNIVSCDFYSPQRVGCEFPKSHTLRRQVLTRDFQKTVKEL